MARLTKIVRSNPMSSFSQVTPAAGGGFGLIADMLETLNERIQPVAAQQLKRQGEERGREAAQANRPATNAARNASMTTHGGPTNAAAEALQAGLVERGLPEHVAQGFVMNFQDESGLNPGINEAKPLVPGSRGGFGLYQLTGPRRVEYERFAQDRGVEASDVDAQLDFLMSELQGSEATAAKSILSAPDAGSAAAEIVNKFLRPSEEHRARRAAKYRSGKAKTPKPNAPPETVEVNEEPTVQIRTKDGDIQVRKYSEFAGPLLQIDTVAAQSAYQDTIINQTAIDLADMRLQFEYNPAGFSQTAKTYVDEIIKAAPDEMRGVLRAEIENEVQRTVLGIQADKSKNVRQRASNANAALMDRYNTEYSDALISGDPEAIAQAEQRLNGVLRVRENLPGSTWTMEDSAGTIFNTRRAARIEAERKQERDFKAYKSDIKDQIDLAITAIKKGHVAAGEGILDDPDVAALFPEMVREGSAFRNLRDEMPNFMQLTPGQMDEAVADMKSVEVQEEWQIDVTEVAGKTAADNRKAWEDDAVKRASEVLVHQPPDIIGAVESGDPAQIMKAMTERRAYMNDLRDKGYFESPTFFSKEEAEALKAVFGSELPAEERAAMAAGIASAFGSNGVHAFNEIDGDKTTMFAGKLLSVGGSGAVAKEIIQGKDLMREGVAKMPEKTTFSSVFNENFSSVFSTTRFPAGVKGEIIEAAQAIYAARSVSSDMSDSDARDALMEESLNAALGAGKNKKGEMTGGVQEVFDTPTALPIGTTASEIERATRAAFNGGVPMPSGGAVRKQGPKPDALDLSAFDAASEQGEPMFNGKPIDRKTYIRSDIGIVALGGQSYGLTITIGGQTYDATGADGKTFTFKMDRLIEATR